MLLRVHHLLHGSPVIDWLFGRRSPHATVHVLVLTPDLVTKDALTGRERGGCREATRHVPRWPLRLHLQLLILKLPDHYFEESFKPIQPI
ncbi:hypothetical protein PF003_g11834 [Phytophthora fragariae]|uniref:Uncharacterized protein n=1 Tax=Phytophthora fragariae TaxID=53985 RepID=A0A6A3FIL4_9STRA|nr:hypothetical protein PF003_g11834 [Phytophthora fragariae]KAE8943830.1 hypothetical protein PF009_g6465 [Phytophthora fragariae]